jgi:hypothetical protein
LRWEECVCQDIRILGVKNWRSVALNREESWIILRKARAHKGLSCQWWWRWNQFHCAASELCSAFFPCFH